MGYRDLRDRLVTKGRSACVATPDLAVRLERGVRMVCLVNAETRARAVRMVRPVQLDDVDYKDRLGMMDQLGRAVRPASVVRMGHLVQPDREASMVDRKATEETLESAVRRVKGAIRARSVEMDRSGQPDIPVGVEREVTRASVDSRVTLGHGERQGHVGRLDFGVTRASVAF